MNIMEKVSFLMLLWQVLMLLCLIVFVILVYKFLNKFLNKK